MAAFSISPELIMAILDDDDIDAAIDAIQTTIPATSRAAHRILAKRRDSTAHVQNYVEETVPRYTNTQFQEHFRMRIDVFEALLEWIAPYMPKERSISLDKNVLATLWYIGNMETYRSVADRFGLSKGSLQRVVNRVCGILVQNQQEWIQWPSTAAEMNKLAEQFEERCSFPGVVGAIDGTHIEIPGPSDFRDAYIDRSGNPSMHLQVTCSKELLFLDVFTGWPGSVHDAQVFENSALEKKLREEGLPHRRFHLLGDSAYPLCSYLLVPFRNDGHLDDVQKKFNKAHSSTRVEVERAVGLLKGKWRKLKFLEMTNVDAMPDVIIAACVLHNFIILKSGVDEDDIVQVSEPEEELNEDCPPQSAQDKRMEIAYQLI